MSQYIVAVLLDGTLNVDAAGPFRSEERAMAACRRINAAGKWTEHKELATIIAQVVRLRAVDALVADASPPDEDEDDDWEDPEECPGCDTPLVECPFPVAGCCPDCTHSLNYDRERIVPADVEIRRQSCREDEGDPEFCAVHADGVFEVGERICDSAADTETGGAQ